MYIIYLKRKNVSHGKNYLDKSDYIIYENKLIN